MKFMYVLFDCEWRGCQKYLVLKWLLSYVENLRLYKLTKTSMLCDLNPKFSESLNFSLAF